MLENHCFRVQKMENYLSFGMEQTKQKVALSCGPSPYEHEFLPSAIVNREHTKQNAQAPRCQGNCPPGHLIQAADRNCCLHPLSPDGCL